MGNAGLLISSATLGFGMDDRIPNREAIAASPGVGWWMFACAICVVVLFILYREHWRRFWLRAEDPRAIGLFRIVFAFLVICNTNDLWEYFEFLFTDEGILPRDAARQVFASGQFRGYGDGFDGEPAGFFDLEAWLLYIQGPRQSILFFWDSPQFFWTQLVIFELVTVLFMLGVRSRLTGAVSWGMMLSIYLRNRLFWEGTELVYCCFFFYLLLARSGHAYSFDNWWRCRRLRKRGLLSEPGGPGGGAGVPAGPPHPQGLQAVYRLIPAWPRKLMILQLAALYCYTGVVKNGSVWARGDALYYALNLDHFYRIYPQHLSAVLGTNVFRVMTWVTHWWEALFPLVVVGLVARWGYRERVPMGSSTRWGVRLAWVGVGLSALGLVISVYPFHFVHRRGGLSLDNEMQLVIAVWLGGMALLGWGFWRLNNRPFDPGRAESWWRHIWLRPFLWPIRWFNRLRGHTDPIDLDWFCRWFLGRRVWLVLGLIFHLHLAALMNIGMFPFIMMATYVAYLEGREADGLVRGLWTAMRRLLPRLPRRVHTPAQDPTLPGLARDAVALPSWTLWAGLVVISTGVVLRVPKFSVLEGITGLGESFSGALGSLGIWMRPAFLDFVLVAVTIAAAASIAQLLWRSSRPRATVLLALLVVVCAGLLYVDLWEFRGDRPGHLVEAGRALITGNEPPEAARPSMQRLWMTRAFLRLGLLAVAGLTWLSVRRRELPQLSTTDERTDRPRPPWAYGPVGRFVIGFGIIWHITAVAVWLTPDKDSFKAFRGEARRPFSTWLLHTHTDQSWGMFAPNPPRHNVFHKALVTDKDGELWDLRTDVYAPERKPIPWIWNDRMRKMNRRMSGGESGGGDWYLKWFARWLCRDWARTHGGEAPVQIELIKLSYRIPSPTQVRKRGWYEPEDLMARTGKQESIHITKCADAVMGQLPDELRERHGLPALESEYKRWNKNRKRNWDRAHGIETQDDRPPPKARVQSR